MGKKQNLIPSSSISFYQESVLNINFMKELILKNNFDYIFHFAAVASVAESIDRPIETNQVNLNSTLEILNILKNMKNSTLKRFIFASSAAVYGNLLDLPKKENSNVNPLTPYAIDKYASEKYTLAFNHLYGIPTSAVRFFNVYGPNQNPESPYSGVISIIIDSFMKNIEDKNTEFSLYGDGNQTRDFIYVEDVIQALELVAYSEKSLGNVYNVGTGSETSLNDLLELVSNIFKDEIKIRNLPERAGDIKKSFAQIDLLKDIGFNQNFTLQEGLEKYIKGNIF